MNERAKKIFICIGSFFVGIFAVICGTILHNKRDTTDENRDRVEQLKREAEQQQRDNREAIEGIDGALATIAEIRKNQKYVPEGDNLDIWYCNRLADDNDDSNKH